MDLSKNFEFVGRTKGSSPSFKINEIALAINVKSRIAISKNFVESSKIGSEGKGIGFMYNDLDKVVVMTVGHEGKNIMLADEKLSFNSAIHAPRIAETLGIIPNEKGQYKVFIGEAQEATDGFTFYQITAEDMSTPNSEIIEQAAPGAENEEGELKTEPGLDTAMLKEDDSEEVPDEVVEEGIDKETLVETTSPTNSEGWPAEDGDLIS